MVAQENQLVSKHSSKFFLAVILLATLLRVLFLTQHDVTDDEALLATRAVGPYDYLEIYTILSPVQTFSEEQWWQRLSFHDHPPLGFWLVHLSIKILGENPWGVRLPSVLAGIGTVVLVYLIGKKLFGEVFGLTSSATLAFLSYHVWASRVAFLESLEVFFMVAALWAFLKAKDNQRWWLLVGLTVGAALLTKYFAILLLPLFFVLLLFYKRSAFKSPYLYMGIGIGILLLLPVIIYNYNLYIAKGYFDSPLSSMLGMTPDVYVQTLGNRTIQGINLQGLLELTHLYIFFEIGIAIIGTIWVIWDAWKERPPRFPYAVILVYGLLVVLITVLVPLKKQYLVISVPFFSWAIGYILFQIVRRYKKGNRLYFFILLLVPFIIFLNAVNSQLNTAPLGYPGITYTDIRPPSFSYRYLENWLNDFYKNRSHRISLYQLEPQVLHYQRQRAKKLSSNATNERELLVWDSGMDFAAVRWLFARRKLYELRPILNSEIFLSDFAALQSEIKNNFDTIYFVFRVIRDENDAITLPNATPSSYLIFRFLIDNGHSPISQIKNSSVKDQFWVFRLDDFGGIDQMTSDSVLSS